MKTSNRQERIKIKKTSITLQDALKTGHLMNTSQQEGLFKIRLHALSLFLLFVFTTLYLTLFTATLRRPVAFLDLWGATVIISFYQMNIKKTETYRFIYICGAGIKSSVFTQRIKHKSMTGRFHLRSPPPLIVRVRLVYPPFSEWQAPPQTSNRVQQRGGTCFSFLGSPGGRVVFSYSDSWAVALTVPAGTCLGGKTCILLQLC